MMPFRAFGSSDAFTDSTAICLSKVGITEVSRIPASLGGGHCRRRLDGGRRGEDQGVVGAEVADGAFSMDRAGGLGGG